ncbi:hypothetical protein SAY87_018663 [Trapa incisa]|uniref:Uncharacterized protein n=1 Tax=Trapa incisa TaxID=236973 RepID=A0AAN7K191_9MYRT|nr:hypothetical protein SAY87_018663 [Trapa incisa]
MRLELYDDANSKVSDMCEDSRPLGFFRLGTVRVAYRSRFLIGDLWRDGSYHSPNYKVIAIGFCSNRKRNPISVVFAVMAVQCGNAIWAAEIIFLALKGWVSSILIVADEVASSLRSGDIGPFHIG